MTETKTFEVRDEGTHIPVMATMITVEPGDYQFLRAGFRLGSQHWIVTNLITMETNYDCFKWNNRRTPVAAHHHIEQKWSDLQSGDVIDVQFIRGETAIRKESER